MYLYLPNEAKQCELIWKPIYDEYRRINYRLKRNIQLSWGFYDGRSKTKENKS